MAPLELLEALRIGVLSPQVYEMGGTELKRKFKLRPKALSAIGSEGSIDKSPCTADAEAGWCCEPWLPTL